MSYSFVDHTADVAADLSGQTLDDLFASAAQALTDTITDLREVRRGTTDTMVVDAGTLEDLLVDWLNELLYRFEVRNLLVAGADVEVQAIGQRWRLDATLHGEPFDPMRHPSRVLVKSATYHGLHIAEQEGKWTARIVLDI